ncbi:MAG: hypothetical protein CMQ21_13820 [Gammaproteobacteria bacterium]|nr:hypothetical protein [Gammaproteobacteria bacterium]
MVCPPSIGFKFSFFLVIFHRKTLDSNVFRVNALKFLGVIPIYQRSDRCDVVAPGSGRTTAVAGIQDRTKNLI